MRRGWLALVLVLGAGCSRSFVSPTAAGTPAPSLDPIDAGAGAFGGQVVQLTGRSFSPQPEIDQVRVGTAFAAVMPDAGAVDASALAIVVPDLGAGAQDVPVTVTVNGRTSNAQVLHYRGPGHPSGFALSFGSDLSPTPTSATGFEGQLVVSLLRNRVFGLALPEQGQELDFSAGNDGFPFGTQVVLGSAAMGGVPVPNNPPFDLALWTSEAIFGNGPPAQRVRTNQGDGGELVLAPVAQVSADISHLDVFDVLLPTPSGLVAYSADAVAGPGIFVRTPGAVSNAGVFNTLVGTPLGGVKGVSLGGALFLAPDAGWMLDRFAVIEGSAPIDRDPLPLTSATAARAQPQPGPLALVPDDGGGGGAAYFLAQGANVGLVVASVDLATGETAQVGEPLGFQADSIAASSSRIAVSGQTNPELVVLARDGSLVSGVPLDGPPFGVSADLTLPDRFYVTVVSPPEVVAVDGATGQLLQKTPLFNRLEVGPIAPDGSVVPVSAIRHPALAVLQTGTLIEDAAGFQHDGPAGQPDVTVPLSTAWRGAGSDLELCGALERISFNGSPGDTQVQTEVRCAPPDAFFTAGCTLSSTGPVPAGSGVDPGRLLTLSDGRLRSVAGGTISDCGSCSDGCAAVGSYPVPPSDQAGHGAVPLSDGDILYVAADRSLQRLTPGGSPRTVCATDNTSGPCVEQGAAAIVADPEGHRAVVIGHDLKLVDLDHGQVIGQVQYFSDVPFSAAFSADGTRLYVGTVIGHVDEYDLRKLDPTGQTPMSPSRRLSTGFSVVQIVPYPDGSKLVLTDLNSDRLYVVQ